MQSDPTHPHVQSLACEHADTHACTCSVEEAYRILKYVPRVPRPSYSKNCLELCRPRVMWQAEVRDGAVEHLKVHLGQQIWREQKRGVLLFCFAFASLCEREDCYVSEVLDKFETVVRCLEAPTQTRRL